MGIHRDNPHGSSAAEAVAIDPNFPFYDVVLVALQLGDLLDEDPTLMEKRQQMAKRLELYQKARDEVDSVSLARYFVY